MTGSVSAAPGWYANPDGRGGWRYWDGARWTEHVWGVPVWHPVFTPSTVVPTVVPTAVRAAEPAASEDAGRQDAELGGAGLPGVGIAIIAFALGAGSAYAVTAALRAAGRPGGDVTLFALSELALWAWLVGSVVFVSRTRGSGSLARDFDWRVRREDWGIGALAAAVARGASVVVAIPLYGAFHDLVRNPQVGVPVHHVSGGLVLAFAVGACVGAPLVEELFFRGLIQTRLVARWGMVRGIAVTSVAFGAAHLIGWRGPVSLLSAAAIAAGGAVLGYVRHRTGRVGTSTVAHALFNLVAIVLAIAGGAL